MQKSLINRRQIGWIAASFAIGIASWLILSVLLRGYAIQVEQGAIANDTNAEKELDLSIAQPSLEPEEVVRLQINSIRDAVNDITKLKVCYSLASPANREFTGPFPRFAELVMLPPYDRLATSVDWQMGRTFVDKNVAAVIVSTVSDQGEVTGFRFILHRQNFPRPDCWLTESVEFISEDAVGYTIKPETDLGQKN